MKPPEMLVKDAFVKVMAVNGDFRYGFIKETHEGGDHLMVCLHDEGDSRIEYEEGADRWVGRAPADYERAFTKAELRVVDKLAAGATAKTAATELGLASSTVRVHVKAAKTKLGITDRKLLQVSAQGVLKHLAKAER